MITDSAFKRQVLAYLRESQVTASSFGVAAANDPHFIPDLRAGRRPRIQTREKVIAYIDQQIAARAAKKPARPGRANGHQPKRR